MARLSGLDAALTSGRRALMTHTSQASYTSATAAFAEGNFRVGRVLSHTMTVLSHRFLTFFIVSFVAFVPIIVLQKATASAERDPAQALTMVGVSLAMLVLMLVLNMLSSAVILHGAFQDMRNRPVSLAESLKVGLRRFLPLMGLAFLVALLMVIGLIFLIIPGLFLYTIWFVSVAACVVERTGAWASMRRSRELTKGHRWKVFGIVLLLILLSLLNPLLQLVLTAAGGETLATIGTAIWTAIGASFSSVIIAVTYYELRAAKEGIDIEQIAAVFD
jgi:hypothetical protein